MSCSKTPDYVISEDKMARLMADIYIGDAVVETEHRTFGNDSLRKVLQQSIYAKHGVTRELVDTSLYWYGHNIQAYMEMCDKTEEILQKRIEEAERAGGKSDFISFNVSSDKNWDRGDRYTLSVKGVNTHNLVTLNMAVDYNDGTTEYRWYNGPADGMNRLLLVLDSAKVASTVYGAIHYAASPKEISYLDSISLVRTRGRNDNVRAREGQNVVKNR